MEYRLAHAGMKVYHVKYPSIKGNIVKLWHNTREWLVYVNYDNGTFVPNEKLSSLRKA